MAGHEVRFTKGTSADLRANRTHAENECRAAGVDPNGVIDFAANVNPLGPPHCLESILADGVSLASKYPASNAGVQSALARAHSVPAETVLVGNGSTNLLYLTTRILQPERSLILGPCPREYTRAAVVAGADVQLNAASAARLFHHDLIAARDVSDYDVVLLANPGDPTGAIIRPHQVFEWAVENPGTFFLVDESYADFVERGGASLIGVRCKNLIVVKSLAKFFAVPGLRLGMLWADPEVVQVIEDRREPWSVNALSQRLGESVYGEQAYITATHEIMRSERSYLVRGLTELGFRVFDSSANFMLARIERKGPTSAQLKKRLLQKGVLVCDCSDFEGLDDRFVRISIRRRHENERLLWAVDDILKAA